MSRFRGFGLVETVVGVGIFVVVFLAIAGLLHLSLRVSIPGRGQAAAAALAESELEYLRGLSYDALGVVGGIPSGSIPATSQMTVNGISYTTRVFISYVDDPADGLEDEDENGILTDYKLARVTVSYEMREIEKEITLLSTFAPPSIESSTGGGTLRVAVVNAIGEGVGGAAVAIVNASTDPVVNLTTFSNASGKVFLGGAAPSSEYEITVTKSGYSSARTYAQTTENVNPSPGLLTVAKDEITVGTFAIDLLSSLTLKTFSPLATTTYADTFADETGLAAMASTTVAGGAVELLPGEASGSARGILYAPQYLAHWGEASAAFALPDATSIHLHIYDAFGALIPDSVLPGNGAGFDAFPLSLAGISSALYPELALGATLETATAESPRLLDWELSAVVGPTPLPNVPFTVAGAKTIGSTSGGTPIYKTVVDSSTGDNGSKTLSLEWDGYAVSVPGYDLIETCPLFPYAIPPAESIEASLVLGPETSSRLLATVQDASGASVEDAFVELSATDFSESKYSSACGSAYFGDVPSGAYTVTISKAGYATAAFPEVSVENQTFFTATFAE